MPETVHNMTLSVSPRLISSAARCEFFPDLQQTVVCLTNFKQWSNRPLLRLVPYVIPRCLIDVGIVDKVANDLDPDFLKPLFPVLADGNCVPRALSLACFGDQDHHTEMRCRIVMELASNCPDYICLDSNYLNLLHILSDSYTSDLSQTFQIETMKVAHNAIYMGMWQFLAAAAPIFSVYPDSGSEVYRNFFTRKLLLMNVTSSHIVTLLWSATPTWCQRPTGQQIMLSLWWAILLRLIVIKLKYLYVNNRLYNVGLFVF